MHGIGIPKADLNFRQMMARKEKIVASFNEGIAALFKKNKITRLTGTATLTSATTIQIAGSNAISARHIILATGSEPIALPFLPFDERRVLSSTGALALSAPPQKMLVVGAGIIGVELGSVYARLGTKVTFVEFLDRICPTLDKSLSRELQRLLESQGMHFSLSSKVTSAQAGEKEVTLQVTLPDNRTEEMGAEGR
jgi:dihydrolipoamide dehydrogenase